MRPDYIKTAAAPSGDELRRLIKAADRLYLRDKGYRRASNRAFVLSLALIVIIAAALKMFVAEPTLVDGGSMTPTLRDGDRILVEKITYLFSTPRRGDIVICHYPGYFQYCVKRVIGLPGETVSIQDGYVHINGRPLDEGEYMNHNQTTYGDMPPMAVPDGHVFVMGDNRAKNGSLDSRHKKVGTIPLERVSGRVESVIWPFPEARSVALD